MGSVDQAKLWQILTIDVVGTLSQVMLIKCAFIFFVDTSTVSTVRSLLFYACANNQLCNRMRC